MAEILDMDQIAKLRMLSTVNWPVGMETKLFDSHEELRVQLAVKIVNGMNSPTRDELRCWKRYAAYCNSCAKSGKADVMEFGDFQTFERPPINERT